MANPSRAQHTVFTTQATVGDRSVLPEDLLSYLVVLAGDDVISRHQVTSEPLTVGRDDARDVVIADSRVSRLHLHVLLSEGRVIAQDLGSSNGTFLDGQRLVGPTIVPEGRCLQIGDSLLKHERRNRREVEREEELQRDLEKARSYVTSLLPPPRPTGAIRTDWKFVPSAQLGGDAFSYGELDQDHLAVYLIDVCGHGVGAAIHSVTALNVLRQRALPNTDFRDPAQVLSSLNAMFQMEDHGGLYFTAWYGVYSLRDRRLAFASAGHHAAYLYAHGRSPRALRTRGLMIGGAPQARFATEIVDVPPDATLYLFSDGVFETTTPDGRQCGLDDLLKLLAGADAVMPGEAARVHGLVRDRSRPGPLDDDFSLLLIRFD